MHQNIYGVRFTISFLALLLVVFLSACSSSEVVTSVAPSPSTSVTSTAPTPLTVPPVDSTIKSVTAPVAAVPKKVVNTIHEKVSYQTPESTEKVDFVFTVDSGVVKDLALISAPVEDKSKKFQAKFMSAITSQVVGKKISEIGTFDRVGGASLTTPAFNQAVVMLKTQS